MESLFPAGWLIQPSNMNAILFLSYWKVQCFFCLLFSTLPLDVTKSYLTHWAFKYWIHLCQSNLDSISSVWYTVGLLSNYFIGNHLVLIFVTMNQIFKNKQTKNIPKQFQNNKHEVTSVVQFPELPSFSPCSCPGSPASSIIQRQANQNTGKSKLSISLSKNGCCLRFRPPLPPSCYAVICYGAPRTKMQAKQFQVLPDVKQMAQATDMMHESAPWWLVPSLDYYDCY